MCILYIGRFIPATLIQTISQDSRGKIGLSNHNFEMSIINGLCQQIHIDFKCITIPSVYSFPYNNKKFYTKAESYDYKNTHIRSCGFCNMPVIKGIWSTLSLTIQIIKHVSQFKGNRVNIIINTPNNNLLNAVRYAKLFTNKQITQTVIIPDIPEIVTAMDKQKPLKRIILKHRNRIAMKKASFSDGLVLLAEAMMDFIYKPIPHIVMEGVVDVASMDISINEMPLEKEIILYTGTLRKIFGVMNLVQAFQMLKGLNVELWICGSGDAKESIETASKNDPRIKFFGLVDSNTALKMQRQASILINPRTSEGEYTKYSFPSKTMEYLLSGKSVIINRLPGIPEEYYEYVYTPKDESIAAMAQCIKEVIGLNKEERHERAIRGKQFVTTQKNSQKQVERILNMISRY